MRSECEVKRVGIGLRRAVGIGMAGMIVGALTLAPMSSAASGREEDGISNERPINRAKVENLQRWVSAGHADWCKDARQVAAEELWRLAADYSGDGFDMNEVKADAVSNGGHRVTFEWAPLDGRALYRVTVQRFDWLLPIAKNTESIVWVPTSIEISTHERASSVYMVPEQGDLAHGESRRGRRGTFRAEARRAPQPRRGTC
jgi:hypothetical protein